MDVLRERFRKLVSDAREALAALAGTSDPREASRIREFLARTPGEPEFFFRALAELGEDRVLTAFAERFRLPYVREVQDLPGLSGDKSRIETAGFLTCWQLAFCPVRVGDREMVLSATPIPLVSTDPERIILVPVRLVLRVLRDFNFSQFLGEGDTKPGRFDMEAFIDYLLAKAIAFGSSDIHLFYDEELSATRVFLRVLGAFKEIERISVREGRGEPPFHMQIANKLYNLIGKDTQSYRQLTDGAFVRNLHGRQIPVRLSSIPVMRRTSREFMPSLVLRILKWGEVSAHRSLESLGFFGRGLQLLRRYKDYPHGIFLVVGPTGSGKTTTLYSILAEKTAQDVCILTVEDPVEMRLAKTRQVEVVAQAGITFGAVMRSFLRHDPDVILVGEIRDRETAQTAVEASLTGHLVFGTVHVNDAYSVVARFTETLGVNPRVLLETLVFVLSQRLVRRLCPKCKERVPFEALTDRLLYPDLSAYEKILAGVDLYVPRGCPACEGQGYTGRTVVFEMIPFTKALREEWLAAISSGRPFPEARAFELSGGVSFGESALEVLRRGETSLLDLERAVGPLPECFPGRKQS